MTPQERRALIKSRLAAKPTCKPLQLTPEVVAQLSRRFEETKAAMLKLEERRRLELEASFRSIVRPVKPASDGAPVDVGS